MEKKEYMIPKNIKLIIDITIGDGWIGYRDNKRRFPYYICEHGEAQIDYCKYKGNLLKEFGYEITEWDKVNTKETSRNFGRRYYRIYSREHLDFHTAHKHVYNKKRKAIDKHLLRDMDVESLAFWFMDDGSVHTTNYILTKHTKVIYNQKYADRYNLATNSFSYGEQLLIVDWLKEKFNLDAKIILNNKRKTYTLNFYGIENKTNLVSLLKPYIEKIPCMLYKISYPNSNKDLEVIDRIDRNISRIETERDAS